MPLATIDVQLRPDASRADQRGDVMVWPETTLRTKLDGAFRLAVPGGATYEVCASVASKPKQCQTADVNAKDLQIVTFTF